MLVDNEPDQFVTLQFSDKIDPNQNLEGLISISNSGATADVSNGNEYNDNAESAPVTETRLSFMIENNTIKIYTGERYTEARDIIISNGVKNSDGKHLKEAITYSVFFEDLKPAVKLVGKGVILPSSNGLIFPFEAVNLNAVDVRITRVYEKKHASVFTG